jgi:hypothetical protein
VTVSRILLDQDVPRPVARLIEHHVVHASQLDRAQLSNGALDNRDSPTGQILLIDQVFIAGDQDIEPGLLGFGDPFYRHTTGKRCARMPSA